jgi:N-acetylglucosaminyldiphosphoundecaprenol N-acetyl-beta-D-mannosaminyltransferase
LWFVTANPEILLEARKNAEYRKAVMVADIRTVDGFGLFLMTEVLRFAKLTQDTFSFRGKSVLPARNASRSEAGGRRKTKRLTGVDLAEHLLQYAWKHHLRVGLLGGEFGEAEKAAKGIREAYPDLEMMVEQGGAISREGEEDAKAEEARHRLIQYSPQILLVAFGHPRQELWIEKHRADFADLKAVVGVGGTFNFWAGHLKRAPSFMRAIGLEWLFRLIQEPRRIGRIWRAVVIFPVLALFDAIR